MRTACKVRAYPDPEQAAQLGRTFGCVRALTLVCGAVATALTRPERDAELLSAQVGAAPAGR